MNVATGESNLIERNEEGFTGYFTDQQLRVLFAFRFTQAGGYELVRRGNDGRWDCFERVDADDLTTTRAVEVSTDGRELYWLDSRCRRSFVVVRTVLARNRCCVGRMVWISHIKLEGDPCLGSPYSCEVAILGSNSARPLRCILQLDPGAQPGALRKPDQHA